MWYNRGMKQAIFVFASLVMGLFSVPAAAFAGPIIRGGEAVSVDASQALQGDFYGFGSTISISGPSEHDAYLAGGTVTVTAPIAEDLTVVGGAVQVHGDVGDDVRVLGGEVTIAGPVKGDVAVIGGTLTILSTASVEGDILFFGETLNVEGAVTGAVHGYAQSARINGAVGGDVDMEVSKDLTLSDRARVAGGVSYASPQELLRAQNAVVGGEINRREIAAHDGVDAKDAFRSIVFMVFALFFIAAAFFLFGARAKAERAVADAFMRAGIRGLIGLAVFVAFPFLAVLLFISIIGIPLGLFALASYAMILMLALGVMVMFIGYTLQRLILKREQLTIWTIAGGACATVAVAAIPVVGTFALFAAFCISVGAVSMLAAEWARD